MNYFKLSIAFLTTILIISCGGDDPLSETIIDSTWQLKSVEITGCDDPTENFNITNVDANNCLETIDETVCNFTFQFFANGEAMLQANYDSDVNTEDLTYTINDDINEVTICGGSSIPDCFIGIADGNTMTFTSADSDGCTLILVMEN